MQKLIDSIYQKLQPENLSLKDLDIEGSHLVALGKPASVYLNELAKHYSFKSQLSYTKMGHAIESGFEQWEGTHPVPSRSNQELTDRLIDRIKDYSHLTFVIIGGASSLLVKPKLPWDRSLHD